MTGSEVSLREFFDIRLGSLERHVDAQFRAMEDAREIAFNSMEKRLDDMNQFREQLREQAASFLKKSEYDLRHDALLKEIDLRNDIIAADLESLKLSRALMEGKASQKSVNIALIFAAIGAISGIIAIIKLFL